MKDKMMSRDDSDYSATDREIDRLVYELYGLTEEEVRIVEQSGEK